MKRWTLRLQITMLVGLVLTFACILLTANSIYSAQGYYGVLDSGAQMGAEPAREDYQEFAAAAKAGIDRLTGTVDALMTLTWGDGAEAIEDIAVRPLLELIFSEQKPSAEAGGVLWTLSGNSRPVRGNSTLVYRALFNLVENAVKYTRPSGRVEVTISDWESRVQIQVSDTGIGMSREAVIHAFDPFYREDRSRSQTIPGAGLGLSVVKAIVERLHGSIALESTEGVGTVVTLII